MNEVRLGYVVVDTWAGRACHAVDVLKENPKTYLIRHRSQVCARVLKGSMKRLAKDKILWSPPSWAVGDRTPLGLL